MILHWWLDEAANDPDIGSSTVIAYATHEDAAWQDVVRVWLGTQAVSFRRCRYADDVMDLVRAGSATYGVVPPGELDDDLAPIGGISLPGDPPLVVVALAGRGGA